MDFDSYNKVKMQYIREVFKLLEEGLKEFRETRFESDVEE